jgi:hypothetical protein
MPCKLSFALDLATTARCNDCNVTGVEKEGKCLPFSFGKNKFSPLVEKRKFLQVEQSIPDLIRICPTTAIGVAHVFCRGNRCRVISKGSGCDECFQIR